MGQFVEVTTMSNHKGQLNLANVVALMPATEEDKETRPMVNTYVIMVTSGADQVLNLRDTIEEIMEARFR